MKTAAVAILVVMAMVPASKATASPISKVVQLLSDLQAKIVAEGAAAQTTYEEFSEWCEHRSKDLQFEIKTGEATAAELQASIEKEAALIGSLNEKIGVLAGDIATDEADLKAATWIRGSEAKDFAAEKSELDEIISMLERALSILEREMQKGGASMLQLKNAGNIAEALGVMVRASAMSSADATRLTALVQSSQKSESDEGEGDVGAPDAAVYKGHSGDIIETLQGLLEKAQEQLSDAMKKETSALHVFQLLKQSLEDEIKFGNDDMDKAQKELAASSGTKATAEGSLAVTSKDLAADTATLGDVHQECLTKAQEFEAAVQSRDEELKALAEAKKVISSETGAADSISYGLAQVSLLQLARSKLTSGVDLAKFEAVRLIFDLAQKESSPALAQLASRISAVMKSGAGAGDDPFGKVKALISDMVARLESEADADATHKAYCDKEISETNVKKADKTDEIEKLSLSIDQMSARSAQLKEESAELQKALAELAAAQVDMDKLRGEENANYLKSKADMEQGLEGVKLALQVLREYYAKADKAHAAAEGAGAGIIGLLEVIEADFSKTLSEIVSTEESAAAAYDQATKDNTIEKTAKDQDVKYKVQESMNLDKATAEATSDRSGVQAEMDAVLEYLASLHKQCDEVAETYAERKRRREAELAGLKEALTILEGEAVLLQKGVVKRAFRGVHAHGRTA